MFRLCSLFIYRKSAPRIGLSLDSCKGVVVDIYRLCSLCNLPHIRHANRVKARFVRDVLCEFCRPAELVQSDGHFYLAYVCPKNRAKARFLQGGVFIIFERWLLGNYEDYILGGQCFLGGLGVSPRGRGCGEDRRAEPRGKVFPLCGFFL